MVKIFGGRRTNNLLANSNIQARSHDQYSLITTTTVPLCNKKILVCPLRPLERKNQIKYFKYSQKIVKKKYLNREWQWQWQSARAQCVYACTVKDKLNIGDL